MNEVEANVLLARLERAERALERSERLAVASRYASAIMHEVNNPLEAITNLVYLTKVQKDDPDQVYENMLIVEDQLRTLGRVTQQALTFHKEQSEARDQDLVEIVVAALKLHDDKFRRHGITIGQRFRGPAVSKVFGSEILQVVSNLILNAVDAMAGAPGKVFLSATSCHGCMHVTITDNGPGIPERFATSLFQPYLTSKVTGTGLGLWLSRKIVEKHGGTLKFRTAVSGPRKGTTFRIHLPASNSA